jgi:SAM-dependent methyltransferase
MKTIENHYPNWKELDIHESSPGNRGASVKLKKHASKYVASQFYTNEKTGSYIDGFRNEDLENQTFADKQFDLVISQDVMEHIYEPDKAFKEIARTLKKGGSHIFTVPLVNKFEKSERWAEKGENGGPKFLHTPEYHGNPIDPEGSPVTYHWGFDIVDHIEKASGLKSKIEYHYNIDCGIWAEYIEVVVTSK